MYLAHDRQTNPHTQSRQPAMAGSAELKWGSGLIGFSPIACLFICVVTRRPELVIIAILGAFAYLMALLLSSLVWVAIPPAKSFAVLTLAVGVLFQAVVRAVLFRLYQRTEVLIKSANHPILHMPLNDVTSSLAAGVGFGLMHATMIFGSVLASGTSDPGVLYAASCTATPMVLVLAFLALAFTLLDVGLMMLTFLYLRRQDGHRLWVPLAIHAAASASTLWNRIFNGCIMALPGVFLMTAGAGVLVAKERRRSALDSPGSI